MKNATVLVIREFGDFSAALIENGFEVINFPTISTSKVENLSELEKNIADIEKYDGIFLTSPKAAAVFLEKFDESYGGKIYVLGNRAKSLFENKGFEIAFNEKANTAEEFINSFDKSEFFGKKFLFLKGDKSLRIIPQMLESFAEIDETILYETNLFEADKASVEKLEQKFLRKEINFICFFSPSGVENFLEVFGNFEQAKTKFAAIGTTTAARMRDLGFKADFTASNAKNFASEFIGYLGKEISATN